MEACRQNAAIGVAIGGELRHPLPIDMALEVDANGKESENQ